MHFKFESEESRKDAQILYTIISSYPDGISEKQLKLAYEAVKDSINDNRQLHEVCVPIVDMKGYILDFKTHNGIRIFKTIDFDVDPTKVHPLITELGPKSRLHDVYAVNIIDCNSFVVHFKEDDGYADRFLYQLNQECNTREFGLTTVEKWMVCPGYCFVVCKAYTSTAKEWIRVKVMTIDDDTGDVVCFGVDDGRYHHFMYSELFVARKISNYKHNLLDTSNQFTDRSLAIRCCLDFNSKPGKTFPMSRTGLRLALCGANPVLESVPLKVRFLAYNDSVDSFTVSIFNENGIPKLDEAIRTIPDLQEMDREFCLTFDGDDSGFVLCFVCLDVRLEFVPTESRFFIQAIY
ncbi:hypothetical protein Ddc_12732 [Ditylenchus destructor]|nr:hypothetical protein Ddc_12732 [Ditylenchus destructor]